MHMHTHTHTHTHTPVMMPLARPGIPWMVVNLLWVKKSSQVALSSELSQKCFHIAVVTALGVREVAEGGMAVEFSMSG